MSKIESEDLYIVYRPMWGESRCHAKTKACDIAKAYDLPVEFHFNKEHYRISKPMPILELLNPTPEITTDA